MTNAIFGAGRVGLLSTKLFTQEKFNRLAESQTLYDVVKILSESGYADGMSLESEQDYIQLLQKELEITVGFFKDLTSDTTVSDCFLLQYDYVNAKMMMKAKYMRVDCLADCYTVGLIDKTQLWDSVSVEEYETLPKEMRVACEKIDLAFFEEKREPSLIDLLLDKAMYAHIVRVLKGCRVQSVKNYFAIEIDTANIITMLRCHRANYPLERFEEMLVSGGTLTADFFREVYAEPVEKWETVSDNRYSALIAKGVSSLQNGSSLYDCTVMAEQMKIETLAPKNYELTIEPLVCYFLSKLREIENVKIIIVGIKNKTDSQRIKDKLKALYV